MDMNGRYRRRIRIIGHPDNLSGWHVEVRDAKTDEAIGNVASVNILLDPAELIVAELCYHETNGDGRFLKGEDGGPIMRKQRLHDLEMDVTALEVESIQGENIARIREALLVWAGAHRGNGVAERAMPRFHEIIDMFEKDER